jgi:1-phosphofructokinase
MAMIYTITLNPALDRTLWVKFIHADDSNRIEREERYAGGKGIDVSKVLATLGVTSRALGFVGGFAGEELEGLLLNEGIPFDFIRISGEIRTNIIINDMSAGTQTVLSAQGPVIRPYKLMDMIHKIEKIEKPEFIIISGSLPGGVHPEIYRRIIEIAKNRGTMTVLDTDGEALKTGIQAFPDIIKPNIYELGRLVDRELDSMDDIISAARSVKDKGVRIVLVSMGAKGILLVSENERHVAVPPKVDVKNTIGAGDASVAGFVYGLSQGKGLRESLVYAVAAGTATTLMPGTALCQKEDFLRLVPQIKCCEFGEKLDEEKLGAESV